MKNPSVPTVILAAGLILVQGAFAHASDAPLIESSVLARPVVGEGHALARQVAQEAKARETREAASAGERLTCRTKDDYNYALYDTLKERLVDKWYGKTKGDCRRVAAASSGGLTCRSDSEGRTLIYDYVNEKSLEDYYSRTVDECLMEIRIAHPTMQCKVNQDGWAALFFKTNVTIDAFYSKSISRCVKVLGLSFNNLTCVSSEIVNGSVGLYNYRTGKMIEGRENISYDECVKDLVAAY